MPTCEANDCDNFNNDNRTSTYDEAIRFNGYYTKMHASK